jgi:2',3'-cyclic-nucleotide 2'-phosphodiesterase (5'-nucleotidase family)
MTVEYTLAGTAQVHTNPPPGDMAGSITTPGTRIVNVTLDDGTPIIVGGLVDPGGPSVRMVTNSFTAAGGDNYRRSMMRPPPTVNLGLQYEQALLTYILSFPETLGLPTIPGTDDLYADSDGEGRYVAV